MTPMATCEHLFKSYRVGDLLDELSHRLAAAR